MKHPTGRVAGRRFLYLIKVVGLLARRLGLARLYYRFIEQRVRETGLFDEAWYLANNADIIEAGVDPLRHFVLFGDREGRSPLRLFDPRHYRSHSDPRCPKIVNSLLHYAWLGRYNGASTSAWFNSGFYLAQYRDAKYSRMDPLLHFLTYGWAQGRLPSEDFDRVRFLRALPQFDPVAASGITQASLPHAELPRQEDWSQIRPASHAGPILVDVIVPVYRGREETLRCLHSVLSAAQQTAFELVVISDASPEVELLTELKALAARGLFTLLENETNEGFVRTVNRGMRLHPSRDVLLLNADAQPFNNWLDKLRAAAYSGDRVASVTPLSNNATICSYPLFNRDNPFMLEIDHAAIDALAAALNHEFTVPAPTGVGFCLYLRRAALDAIGLFDDKAFGVGYGEENDFCQRAIQAGWRNLLTADTYVWHWGSTSFGASRHKRVLGAMEILARRYPRYQRDVDAFIEADPLRPARQRLDEARVARARGKAGNVLIVTHARGGGTERHISEVSTRLRASGHGVFFLRPAAGGRGMLSAPGLAATPNLPAVDVGNVPAIEALIDRLSITEVHIHQLVDFSDGCSETFRLALAGRPAVRLEIAVHDYLSVCPRINLVDISGRYCGEPPEAMCRSCLAQTPLPAEGAVDIVRWRNRSRALYEAAAVVSVPDRDVSIRLERYFPGARFVLRPHEEFSQLPLSPRPLPAPDAALRIVVVGAIAPIKGFEVLHACATDARRRQLPLAFTLIGYSCADARLREAGVTVTGRYEDGQMAALLEQHRPDLVWLPSVWPETYCYTLTPALAAGLEVAAFDLGAIASRIRGSGREGILMPVDWTGDPRRINDQFLQFREKARERGVVLDVKVVEED